MQKALSGRRFNKPFTQRLLPSTCQGSASTRSRSAGSLQGKGDLRPAILLDKFAEVRDRVWRSGCQRAFQAALTELGIRARRQYNCRHTYATMCLMAGMNPAFIATQLGHSVQMLLSTYARRINSSTDWGELGKLENSLIGTKLVQAETVPL